MTNLLVKRTAMETENNSAKQCLNLDLSAMSVLQNKIHFSLFNSDTHTHTHRGKKGSCHFNQERKVLRSHSGPCVVLGQGYHREQNMQRVNVRNVHICGTNISHWKF